MRITSKVVLLAGMALAAGGLGLAVGSAGADTPVTGGRLALSGVGACDLATGNEVVTWTVTNVSFPATDTVTVVSATPGTIAPLSLTLAPKASGTLIQTVPGTATSATLTIHSFVPGIDNEIKPPQTVTLPGQCQVAPVTTTTTAPATIAPPTPPTSAPPTIAPPTPPTSAPPTIAPPTPTSQQAVIQTGGRPPNDIGIVLGELALSPAFLVGALVLWRRRHGAS